MIGTIDTSELIIAVAASIGFLTNFSGEGINFGYATAILAGGVIAAPIAAFLVRHIPPRLLGAGVGGLIILTNTRTIIGKDGFALDTGARWVIYSIIIAIWVGAFAYSFIQYRRDSAAESAEAIREVAERNERDALATTPA